MEAILKMLSQTTCLGEFFYLWSVCRTTLLNLSRFDDGSEWKAGEALVKYFEDKYIKCVDSNHWCRALLDENCSSRRVDRSTVCESFIRSIKRVLVQLGDPQTQSHVEKLLTEKVFSQLWINYQDPELLRAISGDQWDRANVLINLCADFHSNEFDEAMSLRPARRYTYALFAGFIYAMPSDHVPMKINWDYSGNTDCMVNFIDTNEFHLRTQGFVIITGPELVEGRMAQDWYNEAHCTCREFIDNCDTPCVHILAIYIKLCRCKNQTEMAKITSGPANFRALIDKQVNIELSRAKGGYRYPAEVSYGGEFVSNYLLSISLRSKKPLESSKRLELIRSAKQNADIVIKEIMVKSGTQWAPRTKSSCPYTTMLLRNMTSDCFRKRILNYKKTPLPALHVNSSVLGKKHRIEADFPGQHAPNPISKLKRQKLSDKRQGAQIAIEAIKESAAKKFDLQRAKRVSRR